MTTVEIVLPDSLAVEAANAGLLAPDKIELMLRERLRLDRIERLREARVALREHPLPAMTDAEIQAEIDAARVSRPIAPGA